jgi:hypothetical protein
MEAIEPLLKEAHEAAGGFMAYKDLPIHGGSQEALQKPGSPLSVYDCVPEYLKPSADCVAYLISVASTAARATMPQAHVHCDLLDELQTSFSQTVPVLACSRPQ